MNLRKLLLLFVVACLVAPFLFDANRADARRGGGLRPPNDGDVPVIGAPIGDDPDVPTYSG
jgi:hypothetical protein